MFIATNKPETKFLKKDGNCYSITTKREEALEMSDYDTMFAELNKSGLKGIVNVKEEVNQNG